MNWVFILVSVLAVLFLGFAIFAVRELLKKFRIYEQFISAEGYHQKLQFMWKGSKKGRMRNIIIKGSSPFQLLVAFKFPFGGIDFFGTGQSYKVDDRYYAVVSTFLWDPIKLIFEINTPSPSSWIAIELQDKSETEKFPVNIVCNPHFFQRLHFWS